MHRLFPKSLWRGIHGEQLKRLSEAAKLLHCPIYDPNVSELIAYTVNLVDDGLSWAQPHESFLLALQCWYAWWILRSPDRRGNLKIRQRCWKLYDGRLYERHLFHKAQDESWILDCVRYVVITSVMFYRISHRDEGANFVKLILDLFRLLLAGKTRLIYSEVTTYQFLYGQNLATCIIRTVAYPDAAVSNDISPRRLRIFRHLRTSVGYPLKWGSTWLCIGITCMAFSSLFLYLRHWNPKQKYGFHSLSKLHVTQLRIRAEGCVLFESFAHSTARVLVQITLP